MAVSGNTFKTVVIPKPITNDKILPWTEPIQNSVSTDTISIQGCPGEFEPASFVIRSGEVELNNVTITSSDLTAQITGSDGRTTTATIPKENIDIHVVKCWYQAGDKPWEASSKMLKPELLLHDDSIVKVDHTYQVNLIKNYATLDDADNLRSFNVEPKSNKQLWVTLHIPESLQAANYAGTITINADNLPAQTLKVNAEVLPFTLSDPEITYSMFYLLGQYRGSYGSQFRRKEDTIFAELKDMKEHGVYNPTLQQRNFDHAELDMLIDLKEQVGMDKSPLYYTAWPKIPTSTSGLNSIVDHAKNVLSVAESKGISSTYFYGFDELVQSEYNAASPALTAIRATGVKTFQTSWYEDIVSGLGDLLDIIIFHGAPLFQQMTILEPPIIDTVHQKGKKAWTYGYYQAGLEEAETYRRTYGLLLWKSKIDGSCIYAYQCNMLDPWDDWDQGQFRDEMMTYPTVNGIVSTLEWEGFREAVDDIRYMTTLEKLLNAIPDGAEKQSVQNWLNTLDIKSDLDSIRQQMIEKINLLKQIQSN